MYKLKNVAFLSAICLLIASGLLFGTAAQASDSAPGDKACEAPELSLIEALEAGEPNMSVGEPIQKTPFFACLNGCTRGGDLCRANCVSSLFPFRCAYFCDLQYSLCAWRCDILYSE